jgi:hypothetical protein
MKITRDTNAPVVVLGQKPCIGYVPAVIIGAAYIQFKLKFKDYRKR